MPHVLYNHITHTWDQPALEDDWPEAPSHTEEPLEFSPSGRRAIARIALAATATIGGLILWGLIAGVVLGVS